MAIKATIASGITAIQILTGLGIQSGDNSLTIKLASAIATLNAGTTPVGAECAYTEVTMVDGVGSIDLRSLVSPGGKALDGNGMKVRAVIFKAHDDNANPVTVAVGETNGYALSGAAWSTQLSAGETDQLQKKDSTPTIDATHKILDVTGVGTQKLLALIILG